MKKSIKLLTTVSTILAANVFGAGTPESHVLNHNPAFTQFSGVRCDPTAATVAAAWNPKTVYGIMKPDAGNGDQRTWAVMQAIETRFVNTIKGVFPAAKVDEASDWHVTLFTDNALGKYQPSALDRTTQLLLSTVKPFWAFIRYVSFCCI